MVLWFWMPLMSIEILLLKILVIMNISCSEQRYLEQLVTDNNCEFKLLPVHIEKLCHEDHPTTKEDFYIGLTK